MSWEEEDVHMGSFSEIGESLRGMQATQIGAAQRALHQLRGALGQLAGQHFGAHAPVSKQMRSPYKDSTQIGISMSGTFTTTSWAGSSLPTISGLTRVYKSFKPTKAILTELVLVTFSNASLGPRVVAAAVQDSADLVLTSAFSGADNCFPTAPTEANGLSGAAFSPNALGNGISWPTVNGGIDLTVGFSIEQTAMFQVAPPAGYTSSDITQIVVKARFNLWGPSLR